MCFLTPSPQRLVDLVTVLPGPGHRLRMVKGLVEDERAGWAWVRVLEGDERLIGCDVGLPSNQLLQPDDWRRVMFNSREAAVEAFEDLA